MQLETADRLRARAATLRQAGDVGRGRLLVQRAGRRLTLVLDNPDARHALGVGMMADLVDAVAAALDDPPDVILVRPSTRAAFCAGGDLDAVRGSLATPAAGRVMAEAMTPALDALWAGPWVTVAAVPGPAVGGGAELLTAAPLRVWAPDAWCAFAQVTLGVAAGWGGAARLVDAIGRARALDLLTTGRRLTATEALVWGLASRVDDDPFTRSETLVGALLELPGAALRGVVAQASVAPGDPRAIDAFAALWGARDHVEALAAALDRRRTG